MSGNKGCLSILDEATGVIANLLAIADHVVIISNIGFRDLDPQEISGLYMKIPLDFQTHAFLSAIFLLIGMAFVNKKIWEVVGNRELSSSLGGFVLGWFPYQLFASLFVFSSWWIVFRFALNRTGDLFTTLPAFGLFLLIFIIITGLLGLLLQVVAWSDRLD